MARSLLTTFNEHSLLSENYRYLPLKSLFLVNIRMTRTVYVFVSPHLLASQHSIQHVLLKCAVLGTLWSVTLGEAHLFVKQGALFHPKIKMLSKMFFHKVFAKESALQ